MTTLYLIADDDAPLAVVETQPWLPDPNLPEFKENRVTRVLRRLVSPIFPIVFTLGEQTRDVKTFIGETIEDFKSEGFHVYPIRHNFRRGDLINSDNPNNPLVATFSGKYRPSGFMVVNLAKILPVEYWHSKDVRLVESFTPSPKTTDRKTKP